MSEFEHELGSLVCHRATPREAWLVVGRIRRETASWTEYAYLVSRATVGFDRLEMASSEVMKFEH